MSLDLNNKDWKEFELGMLFKIYTGGDLIISRVQKGDIPIISHSIANNGVAEWTEPIPKQKLFNFKRTISLADRGNFYAYTQKTDFYVGTRVKALEAIFSNSNVNILNFICLSINKQSVKFSYGNNATGGVEQLKIMLPVNVNGEPDFEFMEAFISRKKDEKKDYYRKYILNRIKKLKNSEVVGRLEEREWLEFYLKDIFNEIQRGKRLRKADHKKGKKPYVSSTALNNGIDGYVGNKDKVRFFSNCLTIANSGSVGACFYQPFEFVASDHVTQLKNDKFNPYIYKFLSSIVKRLGVKYSFNREMNDTRIKSEKIMLPVNENNEPDYDYMENYMKQLEYKKLTDYLKYTELRNVI